MGIIKDYINGAFKNTVNKEVGIGGFTTFARVNNKTSKKNNVPVTYLEDGSFLEDHIIREPTILSIEGNVSDIFVKPTNIIQEVKRLKSTIASVITYLPERTSYQLHKLEEITSDINNAITEADRLIERGQQIANYAGFLATKSNVNKFLDAMNGLYNSNITITIEMHDRTYENMVITLFETTKDNENNSINFIIEAQEIRYAVSEVVQVTSAINPSATLGGATKNIIDKGVQEGKAVSTSVLTSIFNKLVE